MLSKCANPECSEILRYLYDGKIFYLAPTPDIRIAMGMLRPALRERFWLCARCSKEMTVVWSGPHVTLVRMNEQIASSTPATARKLAIGGKKLRARAASASHEDR
jgi:hypothetical protein